MGLTDITVKRSVKPSNVVRPDLTPTWKFEIDGASDKTFTAHTQGMLILTDGNIQYDLKEDDTDDTIAVLAGMLLVGDINKITAAGTTATALVLGA